MRSSSGAPDSLPSDGTKRCGLPTVINIFKKEIAGTSSRSEILSSNRFSAIQVEILSVRRDGVIEMRGSGCGRERAEHACIGMGSRQHQTVSSRW